MFTVLSEKLKRKTEIVTSCWVTRNVWNGKRKSLYTQAKKYLVRFLGQDVNGKPYNKGDFCLGINSVGTNVLKIINVMSFLLHIVTRELADLL